MEPRDHLLIIHKHRVIIPHLAYNLSDHENNNKLKWKLQQIVHYFSGQVGTHLWKFCHLMIQAKNQGKSDKIIGKFFWHLFNSGRPFTLDKVCFCWLNGLIHFFELLRGNIMHGNIVSHNFKIHNMSLVLSRQQLIKLLSQNMTAIDWVKFSAENMLHPIQWID